MESYFCAELFVWSIKILDINVLRCVRSISSSTSQAAASFDQQAGNNFFTWNNSDLGTPFNGSDLLMSRLSEIYLE